MTPDVLIPSQLGIDTEAVEEQPLDIPITPEETQLWWKRIELSEKLIEIYKKEWKDNIAAYEVRRLDKTPLMDHVVVPKEFAYVEQKKALIMYQVPELVLKPQRPGLEQVATLFGAVMNHELGPDGAKVPDMLEEIKFDLLTCGIAGTRIGYDPVFSERPVMAPVINPMTGQPEVDPQTQQPRTAPQLDPMTGQPAMEPFVLCETYYWESIEPDKLLLPSEFKGKDFDQASWIGEKFELEWETAKRRYNLPDDFNGKKQISLESLSGEKEMVALDGTVQGVEGVSIWYYATRFDPTEVHPWKVRNVVLIKGADLPVVHKDSPYQVWDEMTGQFKVGMIGLPIHPFTLRYTRGSAYPLSDVSVSRHISDELNKGRTQMIQQRQRRMPLNWHDRNRTDPEQMHKVITGEVQGWVGTDGPADQIFGQINSAEFPRENFTFNEIADREFQEAWAMSKSQMGITEDTTRTATELRVQQNAADTRMDAERSQLLRRFVAGARKFGALLQLFKDEPGYVEIIGPQGTQQLQAWNRQSIQGEFIFSAKPDSQLRLDVAQERQQILGLYNQTGKDPNVVRVELLKPLFQRFNIDPTRMVVDQLPEAKPEPPKLSLAVKGEDLNAAAPQFPIVSEILSQLGVQISPQAIQNSMTAASMVPPQQPAGGQPAQPVRPSEHPGQVDRMEPINQHALDRRGTGQGNAAL